VGVGDVSIVWTGPFHASVGDDNGPLVAGEDVTHDPLGRVSEVDNPAETVKHIQDLAAEWGQAPALMTHRRPSKSVVEGVNETEDTKALIEERLDVADLLLERVATLQAEDPGSDPGPCRPEFHERTEVSSGTDDRQLTTRARRQRCQGARLDDGAILQAR